MYRKRFTTIILITLLTILPIISVIMMYHITLCDTLSKMDSGCFGDKNVLYKVADSVNKKEMSEKVELIGDRVALYAEQKNREYIIKAIYFNQYYVNFPMKSGRFFRKGDLTVNNKVAVIGKNLEAETYQKSDDSYILIEGQEYKVIGVIGYDEETMIDNYVYINMLEAENVVETNIYTFDIWGENSLADKEFFGYLSEAGFDAEELTVTQSYGMTFFPQILYGRWFICLFICNLLCVAVVSVQWIKLQKQEIGIRRLVGGSIKNIACQTMAKYLLYVGISIVVSITFCMTEFSGYLHSLTVGYAITVPVMLIILIINIVSVTNIPLTEAIK